MKTKLLSFSILCGLSLGTANATIVNDGFESGLTGWTANGQASVVSSYVASTGPSSSITLLPTEGNAFAILGAGDPTTTLTSSPFTVNTGDTISFDWFFSANDFLPFNDFGGWSLDFLVGGITVAANVLAQVSTVGDFGLTGWNTASVFSPVSGNVALKYYSVNAGDYTFDSVLGIDNVKVSSVPEPATFALLGVGMMMLSVMSIRKSQKSTGSASPA